MAQSLKEAVKLTPLNGRALQGLEATSGESLTRRLWDGRARTSTGMGTGLALEPSRGLPRAGRMLSAISMADGTSQSPAELTPAERIERALVRIEKAAAARAYAQDQLARRHTRLREKISDAIHALDTLMARESHEPEEE